MTKRTAPAITADNGHRPTRQVGPDAHRVQVAFLNTPKPQTHQHPTTSHHKPANMSSDLVDFEAAFPHADGDSERATSTTHRKIELQSPQDLTYLIANITTHAHQRLASKLPANASPELRRQTQALIDQYIASLIDSAKPSISINGLDATDPSLTSLLETEELDPFDTKLAQRVQSLSAQIESQTLQLANLRRKAPQETAQAFIKSFEKQSEEYEERLKLDREARMEAAKGVSVDVGEVERVEEMEATLERGRSDLEALKASVGPTVERMEKARKAVEVVEE